MARGRTNLSVRVAVLAVWLAGCTNASVAIQAALPAGLCSCSCSSCHAHLAEADCDVAQGPNGSAHDRCTVKSQLSDVAESIDPLGGESESSHEQHCPHCPCPACGMGGIAKTTPPNQAASFLPDPSSIGWHRAVLNDHYSFLACTKLKRPPRS